jgi:hypothetical protein
MDTSLLTSFMKKVDIVGECWIWNKAHKERPILNKDKWGCALPRQWAYAYFGNTVIPLKDSYATCGNMLCMNPEHFTYTDTIPLMTQFMEKVDMKGAPTDNLGRCWSWLGCQGKRFGEHKTAHGRLNKVKWGESFAHRWIFKQTYPLIDITGYQLNHKCIDNPSCVNPAHLKKGDQQGNMNDARAQGHIHGQKFTLETATECLKLIKEGARTKDLCIKYKCSKPTIADLKLGRTWKDIPR